MQKFDKILWRINGIIIMLAALAALCMISIGIISSLAISPHSNRGENSHEPELVVIDEVTQKQEILQMGSLNQISRHDHFFTIRLFSEIKNENSVTRRISKSYGKYSNQPIKNYLFYQPFTNYQKWLFDSNSQTIASRKEIYKDPNVRSTSYTTGDTVETLIYTVINKDTNGDKELSSEDKKVLFTSDIDGTNLQILLTDIDNIVEIRQYADDKTIINYHKNGKYLVSIMDDKRVIISTAELMIKEK